MKHILHTILLLALILPIPIVALEKNHYTIAIDSEYIPFTQKDIEGKPTGLFVDFWDYWARKNGHTVSYKFYSSEESLLAVKKGEVDFHSGTTKDREWMHASDVMYELHTTLFTLQKTPILYAKELQHKSVGTIDAYYGDLVKKATNNTVEIKIYEDYEPLVEALKSGEIDALIDDVEAVRYFFIKTGQIHLFRQVKEKNLHFYNKIYAITNSKNSKFLKAINNGLKKLSLKVLVDSERIWLPSMENAFYNKQLKAEKQFTNKEQKWLGINKDISLTGDPLWQPLFTEEGTIYYDGIVGDYVRKIISSIGGELEILPVDRWEKVLEVKEGQGSDIIFGSIDSKTKNKLSKKYDFLKKSVFDPMVIIMDKKVKFVTSLYDIKSKKIGLLSAQEHTSKIKTKYIDYTFVEMNTIDMLLGAIQKGEIDAGLLSLSKAINTLSEDRYHSLDIVGKIDKRTYVDIGVLKEKPILKDIVAKAVLSLDESYREKTISKWTRHLNYIEKMDYALTYVIVSLLGLLLLSTGYYAYRVRKKNREVEQVNRHIEHLSNTDDLTGLSNRRAFTQVLDISGLKKKITCLFFIDIDFFKAYNDFYGHIKGDEALQEVGAQLQTYNRDNSSVFRIGGEEFCIALYNFAEDEALTFADKVRMDIEKLEIVHEKSTFGKVTISVGLSMVKEGQDMRTLYLEADKALYKAKILGRNKTYLFKV